MELWGIWSGFFSIALLACMFGIVFVFWKKNSDANKDKVISSFDGIDEKDAPVPSVVFILYALFFCAALVFCLLYPAIGNWGGLSSYSVEDRNINDSDKKINQIISMSTNDNGSIVLERLSKNQKILNLGRTIYETHCMACHGRSGEGQKHIPRLKNINYLYGSNDSDILASIINGRHGVMAGWSALLDKDQIKDVTFYVLSLSSDRYLTSSRYHINEGKKVFESYCTSCHMINGKPANPSIPDLSDQYWLHGGGFEDVYNVVSNGVDNYMPSFNHLSDQEVYSISAYIKSLQNEEKERLSGLDYEMVERGAYLAKAGDCIGCHMNINGEPYAGGLPFHTPFGTIYSTNISSHVEEGIGSYTFEDFENVMRHGFSDKGIINGWIYPAMPFTSYTYLTEEDMRDLWEWIRSLPSVSKRNNDNHMMFPANIRLGLMFWNILFLDSTPLEFPEEKSKLWKRGKYLSMGLGHCLECHTPRNIAMALQKDKMFQGSYIDGWNALNITANELKEEDWNLEIMTNYLSTGNSERGSAFGGMAEVVDYSLKYLTEYDIQAISTYLLEGDKYNELDPNISPLKPTGFTEESKASPLHQVYMTTCGACHGVDGEGIEGVVPNLYKNGVVMNDSPFNVVAISIRGLASDYRKKGSMFSEMPMNSFNEILNDNQIADLLNYVRQYLGGREPDVDKKMVRVIRAQLERDGYFHEAHESEIDKNGL